MEAKVRQICLCGNHLQGYLLTHIVRRDWSVQIRDTCEWCDKMGWTYFVEDKRNGAH